MPPKGGSRGCIKPLFAWAKSDDSARQGGTHPSVTCWPVYPQALVGQHRNQEADAIQHRTQYCLPTSPWQHKPIYGGQYCVAPHQPSIVQRVPFVWAFLDSKHAAISVSQTNAAHSLQGLSIVASAPPTHLSVCSAPCTFGLALKVMHDGQKEYRQASCAAYLPTLQWAQCRELLVVMVAKTNRPAIQVLRWAPQNHPISGSLRLLASDVYCMWMPCRVSQLPCAMQAP